MRTNKQSETSRLQTNKQPASSSSSVSLPIRHSRNKAQVFIILTMLILIYTVMIASAALQIERAPFIDTHNDTDIVLAYLPNVDRYLTRSIHLVLARVSQGKDTVAAASSTYSTLVLNLRTFLARNGISFSYTLLWVHFEYRTNIGSGNATTESVASGRIVIRYSLSGSETKVEITKAYWLVYSLLPITDGDTVVTLSSSLNGVSQTVAYATVENTATSTFLTSNYDGTYSSSVSLSAGQTINATIDNAIILLGTVR